eukprot:jgi/Chlat1/8477/Chrsp80S07883
MDKGKVDSVVFEGNVQVQVTRVGCEDRLEELTVRIAVGQSSASPNLKALRVRITNEADAFFLHTLEVGEEDFQTLKAEQSILVDFTTFPSKFVELLQLCINVPQAHKPPRFLAVLATRPGESTLSIVETNQFKHLCHIALLFQPGTDHAIKQYLAGRLNEVKSTSQELRSNLARTQQSLESTRAECARIEREFGELREASSRTASELKSLHVVELAEAREKALQHAAELRETAERARAELEQRLRAEASAVQSKAASLDAQVRALQESKYVQDAKISELSAKLRTAETDLAANREEVAKLRSDNLGLDGQRHETGRALNEHLIRRSALEQQVHDKDELISNLTAQLEAMRRHRESLEATLSESRAAAQREGERAAATAAEVAKGNQIIERLQADLRANKSKLKLKTAVIAQQEHLLNERQAVIDKAALDASRLKQELDLRLADNDSLRAKVDDLNAKLEEAKKLQQNNEQMIQWLNTQVNEAQLNRLRSTMSSSARVPASSTRPPGVTTSTPQPSTATPATSTSYHQPLPATATFTPTYRPHPPTSTMPTVQYRPHGTSLSSATDTRPAYESTTTTGSWSVPRYQPSGLSAGMGPAGAASISTTTGGLTTLTSSIANAASATLPSLSTVATKG